MMHKKNYYLHLKKIIRRTFLYNVHLKLLSVIIALGLWFTVTSSKKIDAVKRIPLDIMTSQGLVVSADTPSYVDVKISGPSIFIREIMERKEYIKIDLREKKEGSLFHKFYADMMKLPIGVRVDDFYPTGINVKIEKLRSRSVKIMPTVVGQHQKGYYLYEVKVEPASVELTASDGVLAKMETVFTSSFDISELSTPKSFDVTIDQRYLNLVKSASVERVTAYVDIRPVLIERKFINVKVDAVGQERSSVKPKHVEVIVNGPKELLESISPSAIRAYVDISFNAAGKHSEEVKIKLPEGIVSYSVVPKKVEVVVYRGE